MLIVPLQAVPNQSVTVTLGGQICQIDVYQKSQGLFLDLYVSNAVVVSGVICENLNPLVRSEYLGFVGDLAFVDQQGSADPVYTGLGERWVLAYLTDAELVANAQAYRAELIALAWAQLPLVVPPPPLPNVAPVITSASSFSVAENTTAVTTLTANEPVTWSIVGGADQALFSVNSGSGALAFLVAPDFEAPGDAGANNVYNVTVRATDAGGLTSPDHAIAVTVTDVVEGDPFWADVKLLLGFQGSNGSTTVTDESPSARGNAAVLGNAHIDTSQFLFGSSSGAFDGTGDAFTFPDSADWLFTVSTPFTIEAWIRPASVTGPRFIAAQWGPFIGTLSWALWLEDGVLKWSVSTSTNNVLADIAGGTVVVGVWQHVAISFDTLKYRLFLNGLMVGSFSTPRNLGDPITVLSIGANSTAAGNAFSGHAVEVRLTRAPRYVSDGGFAPPTAAFPRS